LATHDAHRLAYGGDVATLEDLEARVAALEASQADYRAVLSAVNALGANQREHSLRLSALETQVGALETRVDEGFRETRARFRSVDEQLAEIKDLIIGRRNGSP
jgi:predicted  nucleic acid-binding Zn-ribbon protein